MILEPILTIHIANSPLSEIREILVRIHVLPLFYLYSKCSNGSLCCNIELIVELIAILIKKKIAPTGNAFLVFSGETGKGTTNTCIHVFYEEGRMGPLIWSHHLFDLIIILCNMDKHFID